MHDGCCEGDNGVPLQIRVPLKEAASFEFGDATFGMEFNFFSNTVKMCALAEAGGEAGAEILFV